MSKLTHLADSFRPNHYELNYDIAVDKLIFNGQVKIKGKKVGRPSQRITLHAKDLKIKQVKVVNITKNGPLELIPSRINLQKSFDELRIHFDHLIYPGNYEISLEFSGQINDKMAGIYSARQTTNSNNVLIATQFESHSARQAFPCIDEPIAKAIFNLTITSSKKYTILSNTDPISTKVINNKQTVKFKPTPLMSSYLLAFVIGELSYKQATSQHNRRVRVYSTPDLIETSQFGLKTAVDVLDFLEDFFQIDYPLEKCDLVALPDFASGAMENWGLITFREYCLLIDEQQSSLALKQYVADVIAHELAHQWFGNLVTMAWWDDLWLNESFASVMSVIVIDHLHPEWQVWQNFQANDQAVAFSRDSLINSHAISLTIKDPAEISSIFDAISYDKGQSVLYMLYSLIGETSFKQALSQYLKKYSYLNTKSADLWQAFSDNSSLNIAEFIENWTKQTGYPLIKAKVSESLIELSQQRFLASGPLAKNTLKQPTIWQIPLFPSDRLDKQTIMSKTNQRFNLTKAGSIPLVLNSNSAGFYRTIYDESYNLNYLGPAIKSQKLNERQRMMLLRDSFSAGRAGYCSITDSLSLLKFYSTDASYLNWVQIISILSQIQSGMTSQTLISNLKQFAVKLVKKQADRLGLATIKAEDHFDTLLRPIIINRLVSSQDSATIAKLTDLYSNRRQHQLDNNLRMVIYRALAMQNQETTFKEFVTAYKQASSSEEKENLSYGLTSFTKTQLIKQSLQLIKTNLIKKQDYLHFLAYSLRTPEAYQLTFQFIMDNWSFLYDQIGQDISFNELPLIIGSNIIRASDQDQFSEFFKDKITASLERNYNQALERITQNITWCQRDQSAISQFLKNELSKD